MGIKIDFKDVETSFDKHKREVKDLFSRLGREGKSYAEQHGDYNDVTGNLRHSYRYQADEKRLILENTADYASDVERRGRDVLRGAEKMIMEELAR